MHSAKAKIISCILRITNTQNEVYVGYTHNMEFTWKHIRCIATCYGLDGVGIESRWGQGFLHPSIVALRSTQPPIKWVPGPFPGVKWPGCGVDHPPQSSTEVKERVEVYLCSPSGPSWPVRGWTLLLHIRFIEMNGNYKQCCYCLLVRTDPQSHCLLAALILVPCV
jgi:hypothetical protein